MTNSTNSPRPSKTLCERLSDASDRQKRHEFEIGDYWNLCDEAADEIERLRAERLSYIQANAELAKLVPADDKTALPADMDQPWPTRDVLAKLADAVEHLRDAHNCDAHGHEEYWTALRRARELLATPPSETSDARDAARYRWLRAQEHVDIASCWVLPTEEAAANGDELDAAIDRARGALETAVDKFCPVHGFGSMVCTCKPCPLPDPQISSTVETDGGTP